MRLRASLLAGERAYNIENIRRKIDYVVSGNMNCTLSLQLVSTKFTHLVGNDNLQTRSKPAPPRASFLDYFRYQQ